RAGESAAYRCENGDRVLAKYFSLSDNSLNFVKIILPDGKEHTLPQGLSASGARYTDDRELVWWIKGDSARLEVRDNEGNWQPKYNDCNVLPDKK
ncbi:MAG: MliC family protein, partial [Smithella sp.]